MSCGSQRSSRDRLGGCDRLWHCDKGLRSSPDARNAFKIYDALVAVGAHEEAPAAAEELAYESRFAKIETELAVLKRMVGVNLAASLSLVIKAFI